MIEGIAILAIGAAILLYVEMKSNKKTIEQQDYKIRHLTGNLNEEDEKENQQLRDDYHFDKIVRQIKSADEYAEFIPDDIVEEQAKEKFKKLYGNDYKERNRSIYSSERFRLYIPSGQKNET